MGRGYLEMVLLFLQNTIYKKNLKIKFNENKSKLHFIS